MVHRNQDVQAAQAWYMGAVNFFIVPLTVWHQKIYDTSLVDLAGKLDALCYVSKIGIGMEDTLDTIMFYDFFFLHCLCTCLLR